MNFISIGCQCYNAMALKNLGLLKESLPFDHISSNLKGIFELLNNELSVSDFLTIAPNSQHNKMGFWLGHFLDSEEDESTKKRLLENEPINVVFERRFNRLTDYFYNRENVLLYNNLTCGCTENFDYLARILSLNKNNKLLVMLDKKSNLYLKENYNVGIEYSSFKFESNEDKSIKSIAFIEKAILKHYPES